MSEVSEFAKSKIPMILVGNKADLKDRRAVCEIQIQFEKSLFAE